MQAEARSSTWIAAEAPFLGDDNRNGYTIFSYRTSQDLQFTVKSLIYATGPSRWRTEVFTDLKPGTSYFIQVEYFDLDGVVEGGPTTLRRQVFGPVTTPPPPPQAPLGVSVEQATAENGSDEILVAVPIRDDANANSTATFEVAEDVPDMPDYYLKWSLRCGAPPFELPLPQIGGAQEGTFPDPLHPKMCRIRSLTPGATYRIRVRITDPEGIITGPAEQVLRNIRYYGGENVALHKAVAAIPGSTTCCNDPAELTDGRIQYEDSQHGFAWPDSSFCITGACPLAYSMATIDLGQQPIKINRVAIWFHDEEAVPLSWGIETSTDGDTYQPVSSVNEPQCRTATSPLRTGWSYPACEHSVSFAPVLARYVRYRFDPSTLFGIKRPWVVELEVFRAGELTPAPAALSFNAQPAETTSGEQAVSFTNTGLVPVTLQAPRIDPPGAFTFTNRCPAVLNSAAVCAIGVRFVSSGLPGPRLAALVLDHDGEGAPSVVPLSGETVTQALPAVTVDRTSLQFPAVAIGAQTAEQSIRIVVAGVVPAGISVVPPGAGFVINNGCPQPPQQVSPGQCTIRVAFAPNTAETFNDRLTLSWPGGSQEVSLFGSALADTDGDGIPDEWETGPKNVQGEIIDLAAMGASVGVKDVFVELDYLEDAGHTHRPKPEAIQKVVDAYWAKGIALHVDCGPSCVMNPATGATWNDLSRSNPLPHIDPITGSTDALGFLEGKNYSWSSFDAIRSQNLGNARSVIFRYGIFAHSLGGNSDYTGLSRVQMRADQSTASHFIVSLGSYSSVVGNVLEQAGTFMHELGHNLGLTHGGCITENSAVRCDQNPYKPNYLSVMDYLFQTRGLFRLQQDGTYSDGTIDYSDGRLAQLDKANLDETQGLGSGAAGFGTRYWCTNAGEQPIWPADGAIDWNCDTGYGTGIKANIDKQGPDPPTGKLDGASDWDHLDFVGGSIGQAGVPPPEPETTPLDELTWTEDQRIHTVFGVSVKSGPPPRLVPGTSGAATFQVKNLTTWPRISSDTFKLTLTFSPSIASWLNTSRVPAEIMLRPGDTQEISVDVLAPPGSGFGEIVLRAVSVGNSKVFDVGRIAITLNPTVHIQAVEVLTFYKQIRLTAVASDPSESALSYQWRVLSKSAAVINGDTATPDFQFGEGAGDYTFEVKVTNATGQSALDRITITYVGQ